jgi:AraC-like DNA-binding protein
LKSGNGVSNIYLNLLVTHIKRKSINSAKILRRLHLSEYENNAVDKNGTIEQERFLDILHEAEIIFQDKLFSAEIGSYIHPNDYGLLGLILMNCPSYGDAIDLGYRYQHLVNESLCRYPYREEEIVLSRIHDADLSAERIRPYAELEFSMLVHFSHFLTGRFFDQVPITLCFRHNKSAELERYEKLFKTKIKFGQTFNEFNMHEIVLRTPLYGADPQVLKMLMGRVSDVESIRGVEQTFLKKVTVFVQTKIIHCVPSLQECALAFNMSESTFKRRLQNLNMSYQDIVDHVRFSIAKNVLANQGLSIEEVSCVLGFSSTSSFSRSFKRWSGLTPLNYRKKLREYL